MNYTTIVLFSFSIFIAGIIAIFRFKDINKVYYPFLYCIWLGCINEALSYILVRAHYNSSINNNIYVLAESLFILLFFKNLGLFKNSAILFYCMLTSYILGWSTENFMTNSINSLNVYFTIFYSFTIVLMSVSTINELISSSSTNILRNPVFLICAGFIIYYTLKVLVHSFWLYGLNSSRNFLLKVYIIMIYVNLLSNLIYALAVLWMPRKREYTLQF